MTSTASTRWPTAPVAVRLANRDRRVVWNYSFGLAQK